MHTHTSHSGRGYKTPGNRDAQWREGSEALAQSKDELLSTFHDLISEGKAFLRSTAGISGAAVEDAREKFATRIADAKERWGDWAQTARVKGRQAALTADDYVHAKPWWAIALAAGVAFMIAALATRR